VKAVDTFDYNIKIHFPVERMDSLQAVMNYCPDIVIVSWMPLGIDWTSSFRRVSSVSEYMLIGPPKATAHEWETWGIGATDNDVKPPSILDGWESVKLQCSSLQICRLDRDGDVGHSATISFRRLNPDCIEENIIYRIHKEKNYGNVLFGRSHYSLSLESYENCLSLFIMLSESTKQKDLLIAIHLNISLCQLRLKKPLFALQSSMKALQLDDNNIKALYRCGQAFMELGDDSKALTLFERACSISNDITTRLEIKKEISKIVNRDYKTV